MTKEEYIKLWANDEKRRAFLKNYKSWGVWLTVPELDLVFYRHELPNGVKILAMEYQQKDWNPYRSNKVDHFTEIRLYLWEYEKFMPNQSNEHFIAEYLLNLKKEYQNEI
jgi:hypothetical protein